MDVFFRGGKIRIRIYDIIIAEILLQRTQSGNDRKIFYQDFINTFPSWEDIAKTGEKELANFLKPIGLWRRRSVTLIALAREMVKNNGVFPRQREKK